MTLLECPTCHATYSPVCPDGVRYFHACPPLSDAEVCAALGLSVDPTKRSATESAQLAAASRVRPNARDENIDLAKVAALIDEKTGARRAHTDRDLQKAPGAAPIVK